MKDRMDPAYIVGIVGIIATAIVFVTLWALLAYNAHNNDVRRIRRIQAEITACSHLPLEAQAMCIANVVGAYNTTTAISH